MPAPRFHPSFPLLQRLTLVLSICALPCCTGKVLRKKTDRQVFSIVRNNLKGIPNAGDHLLSVTPPAPVSLEQLEKNAETQDFLGDRKHIEQGSRVLSLAEALDLAVHHNRSYLGEKEGVYLTALDLALMRYSYSPIAAAAGSGSETRTQVETTVKPAVTQQEVQPDGTVTTAIIAPAVNDFITQSTQQTRGNVGFAMLGRAGTQIALDLATDFTRFLTGDLKRISDSKLAVSVSQPLLRGAGRLGAREPLTQAERDSLYSIRTFTQYRKSFAVDIAAAYYQTLQSREAARNAYVAYVNFAGDKGVLETAVALAEADKRTKSSLGQLRQAELTYKRRWITAIQNYESQLDTLKIELGIPVTEKILLDQSDFKKLEIVHPTETVEAAIDVALKSRLDLINARDALTDATRKVKVAEQNLLPGINVGFKYDIVGDPGSTKTNIDGRRRTITPFLNVDPNLDRRAERLDVRAAEIAEQRARRTLELAEENVRKEVRASWRSLELAKKQYEIAQQDIRQSEERLALERELTAVDQGTPRDLIEAQAAMINARDFNNAALIAHTIARLGFYRDMGILFIRNDGAWEDVLKKEKPQGEKKP
jgi:outer membrane protein TolC